MEEQNKEKENKIQLKSLRAKAEEKLAHPTGPDAELKEKSYYEEIIHPKNAFKKGAPVESSLSRHYLDYSYQS